MAATKSFSTCSASPDRSSPWSTNTQVSWSPTALCTRAAATEESTPPDRPQITRAAPTCARIVSTCSVDDVAGVPVGREAARPRSRKFSSTCCPCGGVLDLGVPLHAVQPAGVGPRTRRPAARRLTSRAPRSPRAPRARRRRGSSTRSATAGLPRAARVPGGGDLDRRAAVLALPGLGDRRRRAPRHRLEAVADAEHRDAGLEQGRVDERGAGRRTPTTGRRRG